MNAPKQVAKILTPNDLGLTGSHQAGIAIPRDPDLLGFFPKLDSTQYNPDCVICVDAPQTGRYWDLRFVYYNNKVHGQGTRKEYRLTGTTRLLREAKASVGDKVTFQRNNLGDIQVNIEEITRDVQSTRGERFLSNGWVLTMEEEVN